MVLILNKLDQPLIVNLLGGKSLHLPAKGSAYISEKDLGSTHIQTLKSKGVILQMGTVKGKQSPNLKKVSKNS